MPGFDVIVGEHKIEFDRVMVLAPNLKFVLTALFFFEIVD
jgi:hypothetical protein